MSIKKTETDIYLDIKELEEEILKYEETAYLIEGNYQYNELMQLQGRLQYAKTLIDY